MPDPIGWAVLVVGALAGSLVGGVAGFGTGIFMLPLVAWVLGLRSAVRGLVGRAEAPRPHERSRVSRHHRGPAGPPGLALASLSAVKPDLVDIEIGATAEVVYTVDDSKTAHAMGNRGVHVFATPFVIGMLEDAAGAVMRPHLPSGAGSVGTMVEMKHLAPTPVGLKVRAKASLLESA